MLRFPHLAEQIFQKLDNEGLAKSREVEQVWQTFIDQRDYSWLRIVNIPNVLPKGNTFCHLAAEHGQIDVFEMLLNEDNNTDPENIFGETPFVFACSKGRMNIVAMLLKKSDGLKINLNQRTNDNDFATRIHYTDVTGFHLACLNGHSEVAEMIMNASSRLKIDLNIKDKWGASAFQLACMKGHSNIAKSIINKSSKLKIELNTKDKGNSTAFHLVCYYGCVDVAELLLENASKLEMDWNGKNFFGTTAFQLACSLGHPKIAEIIMNNSEQLKIDLNSKARNDGATAFHKACSRRDSEIMTSNCAKIVKMLIEQSECLKIDLTAKNNRGENGFQVAEYSKNTEVMNIIKTKMPILVV